MISPAMQGPSLSALEQTRQPEPIREARPDFWRDIWRGARRDSFLKLSQEATPERWQDFYARVSDIYLDLWGHRGQVGRRVTGLLWEEGLCATGCRVLDVGCGPGTLALPLARAGARVTALDLNPAMLEALCTRARTQGLDNLRPVQAAWDAYTPRDRPDLVLASFFPEALSVRGLTRLEGLSGRSVALVLGTGEEPFAFRREVWDRVLDVPFHQGGFHLACALGWLLASGRRPNLRHLSWPEEFDQPLERVLRFYQAYFAIFGREGRETEQALRRALEGWRQGDRVKAQGRASLAVLWWPAPDAGETE